MGSAAAIRAAINQQAQVVADYAPDPRGTSMFAALAGNQQTGIDGSDGYVLPGDKGSGQAGVSFNGDVGKNLQHFTGAAALSMYGTARPISTTSATFDTAQAAADGLNDLPLRIFAARAARKGGGLT